VKPEVAARRISQYRDAVNGLEEKGPVITYHAIGVNAERLKLRYDLERQLKALAVSAEEAMCHHA
jgi:hypothetical protein